MEQENDQMTQTFNFKILKFHFKITNFLELYSINCAKPYAKNTAYKGIQCKVTKLWSI